MYRSLTLMIIERKTYLLTKQLHFTILAKSKARLINTTQLSSNSVHTQDIYIYIFGNNTQSNKERIRIIQKTNRNR